MEQGKKPIQGYVAIGKVLGAWGLRGEVRVMPLTDFPERFSQGQDLYMRGQVVTVEGSRLQGRRLVVKFRNVDTRTQAEALHRSLLEVPDDALHSLPPGEFYRHQLMGLGVWSSGGAYLGHIADVLPTGANDVFLVQGEDGEHAIPNLREVVQEVDLQSNRMVIDVIPGLVN